MTKNKSVFGIYRGNLEPAVNRFEHAGFSNSDASILLPENINAEELATEQSTKAPEGAAVGVGSERQSEAHWLARRIGALAIPGLVR